MRALIVDDSRAMRGIIRRMLGEIGFETVEAAHGMEAIQCLRDAGQVDVMLVDWNMPEMNGYEFVRAVRADPAYSGVRLVMVTTETEIAQVAVALEAGADEYIMKPFDGDILHSKFSEAGLV